MFSREFWRTLCFSSADQVQSLTPLYELCAGTQYVQCTVKKQRRRGCDARSLVLHDLWDVLSSRLMRYYISQAGNAIEQKQRISATRSVATPSRCSSVIFSSEAHYSYNDSFGWLVAVLANFRLLGPSQLAC
jgi:hypothetical protein